MTNKTKHRTTELFSLPGTAYQCALASVDDTTQVFADTIDVAPVPVPGHPAFTYIPWGEDDQLPYDVIDRIGQDEVTSQNKLFNVLTCYGRGIQFTDTTTHTPTTDPEVRRWRLRQNLPSYFLEQCTDMKYFFMTVTVIILSRDGNHINRIVHKEACDCRIQAPDKNGRIHNIFYGNWRDRRSRPTPIERIPLLDIHDPIGDLMQRMGVEPCPDGLNHAGHERKFAILQRFPTAGCMYYPIPYYAAIFRGGSYDEKRLIGAGKRAKLKNHTSVKYQVEVHRDYWDRICDEEDLFDPEQREARVRREKENIRDFVAGIENSGKVWITGFYVNPDGKEVRDIRVVNIESGSKEGGDWADDLNAASNTICYGDNVHPNLVGATPGKSQSNNSGSDKRELFTMKQSLETAFHDILLLPLQLVCEYNKWNNVYPEVPMILLTTLDKHTDAVEISRK